MSNENFIEQIVSDDLATGKHQKIVTRFPPEPNGFLHIGHAKAISVNFGLAKKYAGVCHLRFDDTNPEKEEKKYVDAIKKDILWLGFDWGEHLFFSSDYFFELFDFAMGLIDRNLAYVCELDGETMRAYRGTLTEGGKDSPFRNRNILENRALFQGMREGKFRDGQYTLRAKIDMKSPNMHMRDPVLYRIKKVPHQRTGEEWPIYPMYDFTHCLSDAIEGVTHSCCSLEFEEHRPLYDWVVKESGAFHTPRQIEFSRMNLEFTVLSKRYLQQLVQKKYVSGWDDPRMPTLSGMRKRGYLPASIRHFCVQTGVTKKNHTVAMSTLEHAVREELGPVTPRIFAVLSPLKIVITNWEEGKIQEIQAPYHPQDESFGTRKIPLTKEIYIEQEDFKEEANRKFFRLKKGGNVRLKYGYVITCDEVIKNSEGEIVELRCTYLPETFAGATPEGMKKVKGIIHWVSASHGVRAKAHLYDRLFSVPNPLAHKEKEKDFTDFLNSASLATIYPIVENSIENAKVGMRYQFERQGYFIVDAIEHDFKEQKDEVIFNRIITLKDTWANIEKEFVS